MWHSRQDIQSHNADVKMRICRRHKKEAEETAKVLSKTKTEGADRSPPKIRIIKIRKDK